MADNVVVLDGNSVPRTLRTKADLAGNLIPVSMPNSSDGQDFSANPQSLAGLALLATIAGDEARAGFMVQSQDTGLLYVVLDDTLGATTPTVFVLTGAGGTGQQGGSLTMSGGLPHSGRIRVYASGGSYHMACRVW